MDGAVIRREKWSVASTSKTISLLGVVLLLPLLFTCCRFHFHQGRWNSFIFLHFLNGQIDILETLLSCYIVMIKSLHVLSCLYTAIYIHIHFLLAKAPNRKYFNSKTSRLMVNERLFSVLRKTLIRLQTAQEHVATVDSVGREESNDVQLLTFNRVKVPSQAFWSGGGRRVLWPSVDKQLQTNLRKPSFTGDRG